MSWVSAPLYPSSLIKVGRNALYSAMLMGIAHEMTAPVKIAIPYVMEANVSMVVMTTHEGSGAGRKTTRAHAGDEFAQSRGRFLRPFSR